MKQLGLVYLFNWYAMFIYWQFITLCLAKTIYNTSIATSSGFSAAQLLTGKVNGIYNIVTFCVAFLLAWFTQKTAAKKVHFISLLLAGIGLIYLPYINNEALLFIPMIGFGIGWASMMGTPYIILAGSIPSNKTGVYMGILNMFIVLPMLIETISFRTIYNNLLSSNPVNAIQFAGVLIIISSVLTLLIKNKNASK
jgi:maltose/moltooligosaccharide transporter